MSKINNYQPGNRTTAYAILVLAGMNEENALSYVKATTTRDKAAVRAAAKRWDMLSGKLNAEELKWAKSVMGKTPVSSRVNSTNIAMKVTKIPAGEIRVKSGTKVLISKNKAVVTW